MGEVNEPKMEGAAKLEETAEMLEEELGKLKDLCAFWEEPAQESDEGDLLLPEVPRLERLRTLGKGAFGTVCLARTVGSTTGPYCVAKDIPVAHLSEGRRRRAAREAKVLCGVSHPNILAWVGVALEETHLVVVSEYADGGDLAAQLSARRASQQAFHRREIVSVIQQVAAGLCHIHSRRILHRNLKPSNILYARGGIRLGDIGIPQVLAGTSTGDRAVPHYLPPEICANEAYRPESDVWSLGVVAYELATLCLPFSGGSTPAVLEAIRNTEPRPVPGLLGKGLCRLISAMLDKSMPRRPTAEELEQGHLLQRGSLTSQSQNSSRSHQSNVSARSRLSAETCWTHSHRTPARPRGRRSTRPTTPSTEESVLRGGLEAVECRPSPTLVSNTLTTGGESCRNRNRRAVRPSRQGALRRAHGSVVRVTSALKKRPSQELRQHDDRLCLCCQWPEPKELQKEEQRTVNVDVTLRDPARGKDMGKVNSGRSSVPKAPGLFKQTTGSSIFELSRSSSMVHGRSSGSKESGHSKSRRFQRLRRSVLPEVLREDADPELAALAVTQKGGRGHEQGSSSCRDNCCLMM